MCQGKFYSWNTPLGDFSEQRSYASASPFKKSHTLESVVEVFVTELCFLLVLGVLIFFPSTPSLILGKGLYFSL